jgi:hypothetical protein
MTHAASELNIEAALQRPRSYFAEPKDVVAHPTLSREDKLAILREWELAASIHRGATRPAQVARFAAW